MNNSPFKLRQVSFYAIWLFSLLLLAACSTDATDEVLTPDAEMSDDPTAEDDKEDDTEDNMEDEQDEPGTPDTGAVTFESGFTLSESRSLTNLVLSAQEYNKFITGDGDLKMVSQKAYQYMKDDFDFIIILSVEETQPDDLFYGRSTPVQNKVQGLGGGTYDLSANYGSSGRLNAIIYMPRAEYIRNGPFLHEIAHSWGNKGFIPTTVGGHWGYASTAGQLGGFDELIDMGNGTYKGRLNDRDGFGTFANGGNSVAYGNLELYLMGLIGPDALEAIQVASNPVRGTTAGEFTADAVEVYTPEALIATHGARVPSAMNSQKDFTALAIIISKEPISEEKMATITNNLDNFSQQGAPDASWGSLNNFWMATQGKATFSFEVQQQTLR